MNIGWLLALLVLLAAFVLYLIGKVDPVVAGMFAGLSLAILLLVFSLYPVYAGHLPGPIAGFSLSFADTIRYQTASVEAVRASPCGCSARS